MLKDLGKQQLSLWTDRGLQALVRYDFTSPMTERAVLSRPHIYPHILLHYRSSSLSISLFTRLSER